MLSWIGLSISSTSAMSISRNGSRRFEIKEMDATKLKHRKLAKFPAAWPPMPTQQDRSLILKRMALLFLSRRNGAAQKEYRPFRRRHCCEECKERAREHPPLLLVGPRDPSPAQLSSFSSTALFEWERRFVKESVPLIKVKRQIRLLQRKSSAHLSCWLAPEAAVCCACACKISSRCCRGLSI